ncbi:unnamed protein product [Ilex paraguariensis]|uniref:Protein NBR1 homolog n=1 Tax=Ilex paraguariensis TaxID=185542 RepID=A0ABC8SMF9_9AQUA
MESTKVIKVKYGETLRRFNARIVDGELDLDMDRLREKVLGFFNFTPDSDLTLTYIDEDGDMVTLADEEDLCDVMRQSLNPLRITVKLNTETSGRSYARSSGSSTPMRSPRVLHPIQNLNTGVSEILRSVPEPFREAISNMSINLASKATSTAPGIAELVDSLSKMGLSYLNPVSEFQTGAESSTQIQASKGPVASKVDGVTSEVLPSAKAEAPTLANNQVLPNTKSQQPTVENNKVEVENTARGVEAAVMQTPSVDPTPSTGYLNLNGGLPGDNYLFGSASSNPAPDTFPVAAGNNMEEVLYVPSGNNKLKVKKLAEFHSNGKSDALAFENGMPGATKAPAGDKNNEINKSNEGRLGQKFAGSYHDFPKHSSRDSLNKDLRGGVNIKCGSDFGNSSTSRAGQNPMNECPFSGMPLASDLFLPPSQSDPRMVSFKRRYNHSDGMGIIFHRGVRCDGCGVHPITGPRFKSKVKEDYDLCSICFAEMGNGVDYIRMDRPMTYGHPFSFKGLYDHPLHHSRVRPPTIPQVLRGCGMKQNRPKLDSRFIQDVNVFDGTIMSPSTPFTKIWRMRNNGTIMWPEGTQLVWIGGDRLSNTFSLQITADGLPVDMELDIAVDFTAPQFPGRYISYWRMASPSGQKFGQRVWVLIQVDASLKDSTCESFQGLNLNLPPVGNGATGPEIVSVNVEPKAEDNLPEPVNSNNRVTELVVPIVNANPNKEQELNFPINDTLLVGGGIPSPVHPQPSSSVSYPIIDLSEAPVVPLSAPSPAKDAQASAPMAGENNVEQTLLRELEEMGFRQVDLNKEVLRANEYDLEQSVDDLCGASEWDPILEELQEMGFFDKEMNKKLLKKNNGSIKRVVMDLIAGEKA